MRIGKRERRKCVTEEIKKREVRQQKRKYEKDEQSGPFEHQSSDDRLEPIKHYWTKRESLNQCCYKLLNT